MIPSGSISDTHKERKRCQYFVLKGTNRSHGFTLVELVVVVVILAIVSSLAVVSYNKFIPSAEKSADETNLSQLNTATSAYQVMDPTGFLAFQADATDNLRQLRLVNAHYLGNVLVPEAVGMSFVWSVENKTWSYTSDSTQVYNFGSGPAKPTDFLRTDTWIKTNQGFVSSYGRLYIPNLRTEYTITTMATLSAGTNPEPMGGYGILFNTSLPLPIPPGETTKDTGYALQFDRGYAINNTPAGRTGAILVRPRTNGAEGGPGANVWTCANTGGCDKSSLVHNKQTDPGWWTATHKFTIKVVPSGSQIKVTFSIDDQVLFANVTLNNPAQVNNNFVGLRTWGGSLYGSTTFESLSVSGH